MVDVFRFLGILGIVLISIGILNKKRKKQDLYYIVGGICLLAYSYSIGDVIFMILQIIFAFSAVYDFSKKKSR